MQKTFCKAEFFSAIFVCAIGNGLSEQPLPVFSFTTHGNAGNEFVIIIILRQPQTTTKNHLQGLLFAKQFPSKTMHLPRRISLM